MLKVLTRRVLLVLISIPKSTYNIYFHGKINKSPRATGRSPDIATADMQMLCNIFPIVCKDSAPRPSQLWRIRFLKVFTIYGHGGYLGQLTATILSIFGFPTLRWLHMKFEQNWLRGFRGKVVWNSKQFSHSNVWGSYKCIRNRT